MKSRAFVCVVLLLASCSSEDGRAEPEGVPAPSGPVVLVDTPPDVLDKCLRHPELQQACPTRVPAVTALFHELSRSSVESGSVWVFFAEWNAPRPGLHPENAPPRFAHLNVFSGDLDVFGSVAARRRLYDDPARKRKHGVTLGSRRWNGRAGEVLLAPSYPHGGMQGDHLVFEWTEGGRDYSISLHAWQPLDETIATLKAVVDSLP